MTTDSAPVRITRRRLLSAGAVLPVAATAASQLIRRDMPWQEGTAAEPTAATQASQGNQYAFLAAAEAAFVEAAVARIIPHDELGPGALEAGAAVFIDRQLAGEFGRGERWYMQGPWAKGEKTQGYQTRMTPANLYRAAIREIDAAVGHEGKAASFAKLAVAEQDRWLKDLEDGKPQLPTADAKTFFTMLLQNTLEGFWSDPVYGGNRDMAGWKLIGFPGAHYDYTAYVGKHGEAFPLPPTGLGGRPAWRKEGSNG
ncbi:gluconate 2-dehydrogenase subunit 3 family protein [Ramlibacter sp. G-1-2-2]|uniref:Gluconate 2-dehydrogenase subunit 3 family protein n=1 Tax=Ramlibacter agri TaxID=2728837 RepID=A0A848GYB0_9BURK|nr:gluconate 2-dehydrogenase subunit 3 family protein [Ramlibacter agri]NML42299.1 gluconate 2-dehydrogenase subunit 3 family protein [Ramlibacter agri]